jgi:hypothetical protein
VGEKIKPFDKGAEKYFRQVRSKPRTFLKKLVALQMEQVLVDMLLCLVTPGCPLCVGVVGRACNQDRMV